MSGAPQNMPMSKGTTRRRKSENTCSGPSAAVKVVVAAGQS
jgi:hypothetical protein